MMEPVFGHNENFRTLLRLHESGKLHHAWLFEGPKGIGKSMAAYRFAAAVLGAGYDYSETGFSVHDDDVSQHLVAGSHPDFRYIQKTDHETGKARQDIPVEEMRKLSGFFSLRPALGGYRVAIVDSVDELNPNGANALLKTLEEPPARCILILIYHGKSGLLPTIRSRCQSIRFSPLNNDDMKDVLERQDEPIDQNDQLLTLSAGSPGKGLAFSSINSGPLLQALNDLTQKTWPTPSPDLLNTLQRAMSESDLHFDLSLSFIEHWMVNQISETTEPSRRAIIAKAWEAIQLAVGHTAQLKLDLTERSAKCVATINDLSKRIEVSHAF